MTLNIGHLGQRNQLAHEDSDGEAIMHGGDYSVNAATYVSRAVGGGHTLIMEDTNGDGLCSIDFGDDGISDIGGSMNLTNAAGDVLVELDNTTNNYGYEGSWEVCASEVSEMEGCADENNNGICDAAEISGCQDVTACNFTPWCHFGRRCCTFAEQYYHLRGQCHCDEDGDGCVVSWKPMDAPMRPRATMSRTPLTTTAHASSRRVLGVLTPIARSTRARQFLAVVLPRHPLQLRRPCTNDVDGDGTAPRNRGMR